jgi:hypothetical protein
MSTAVATPAMMAISAASDRPPPVAMLLGVGVVVVADELVGVVAVAADLDVS